MTAPVVLDLPPETLAALRANARAAGMSPSQHAKQLLAKALITDTAKTPCRAEARPHDLEYLLASLRALLAKDLSRAHSWANLQDRLARQGYTFRERGGGLALFSTTTATRICKASDLGWTYADLIRRFDAPFPGHSHTHVAQRVLKRAITRSQDHPSLFPDSDDLFADEDDDENIVLFEDE